jgi:asparagine synthase (glutamine-hydrolysing)
MCGIVGLLYRDPARPCDAALLHGMAARIAHRGPDDAGVFVDGNIGIGMRRLSIIDLAGGHQPMFNEDEQIGIVFNGEIFNYQDIRRELEPFGHVFRTRSDTEVLLHGYETWGDTLPGRLNGMFAFALLDRRRRRVLLGRDHIGVKPLYLYEDGEKIAWASEIKALLALPGVRPELDPLALADFLSFGYVPAPRTMFRGIRKVPPATIVSIDEHGCAAHRYWDLQFPEDDAGTIESWCEQVRWLVDDAVRRQLMSDVPLGAFLSGGVDSSSIVATMSRLGVGRISTYSIGFTGADAFHSELEDAAYTARLFGTDHHEIVVEPRASELLEPLVRHLDEPMTDTSFIVTWLVSRLARETVKVILSGVGGDEIFAGYRRYLGPRLQQWYGVVPRTVHRRLVWPLVRQLPSDRGSAWKSGVRYARGFLEHADQSDADRYQHYVGVYGGEQIDRLLSEPFAGMIGPYRPGQVADAYAAAPARDALNRMLYADLKTALVDSLLLFTDKMTMAVSLEGRVPLLDYRLVELAAKIPPRFRLRGLSGLKHVFKRAMSDRLPDVILNRRKRGFGTPMSRWFRGDLRPLLHDLLSPDRVKARGYFNPGAVAQLIDDHQTERADCSEHLVALLTFEMWHQAYLDHQPSEAWQERDRPGELVVKVGSR